MSHYLCQMDGLKSSLLRVDLCPEVRLGLVTSWLRIWRWFLVCSSNNVKLAELVQEASK